EVVVSGQTRQADGGVGDVVGLHQRDGFLAEYLLVQLLLVLVILELEVRDRLRFRRSLALGSSVGLGTFVLVHHSHDLLRPFDRQHELGSELRRYRLDLVLLAHDRQGQRSDELFVILECHYTSLSVRWVKAPWPPHTHQRCRWPGCRSWCSLTAPHSLSKDFSVMKIF